MYPRIVLTSEYSPFNTPEHWKRSVVMKNPERQSKRGCAENHKIPPVHHAAPQKTTKCRKVPFKIIKYNKVLYQNPPSATLRTTK